MARALVTGATGFIGRHLVRTLVARGDAVTCFVRATSRREGLEGPGVRVSVGDVLDPPSLAGPVAEADVVYHLAALLRAPWRHEKTRHDERSEPAQERDVSERRGSARKPHHNQPSSSLMTCPPRGD